MGRYLAKRVVQSVLTLGGVIVLVFIAVRLTGDPAVMYLPLDAPQELREQFSQSRGFNDPIPEQLARYVGGLAQGDFGESLRRGEPALDVVLRHYPYTLLLAAIAIGLASTLAIVAGTIGGSRPMSLVDRIVSLSSLLSASTPDFWLGLMLVYFVAIVAGLLPTSGTGGWQYWILPVATLMARPFGLLTQVVRGSMIEALSAPYVATARAKGVPEVRVRYVHALRNAVIPIITVVGDLVVGVINGAVVVESIFGIPGVGKLMIDSINQRDFAIVQAVVLVTGACIIGLNLAIDVLYMSANPRFRHQVLAT